MNIGYSLRNWRK